MNNPKNPKERNLLKGAMRRIFSRSDLRKTVIEKSLIEHSDPKRPRVTKWAFCTECGLIDAAYKHQVDHVSPVIATTETLEDLSWDELVDRLWCDETNLKLVCVPCHKEKSKQENKERRLHKKAKNEKS